MRQLTPQRLYRWEQVSAKLAYMSLSAKIIRSAINTFKHSLEWRKHSNEKLLNRCLNYKRSKLHTCLKNLIIHNILLCTEGASLSGHAMNEDIHPSQCQHKSRDNQNSNDPHANKAFPYMLAHPLLSAQSYLSLQ
jgi:hypothetical protein